MSPDQAQVPMTRWQVEPFDHHRAPQCIDLPRFPPQDHPEGQHGVLSGWNCGEMGGGAVRRYSPAIITAGLCQQSTFSNFGDR
jgi:hypothetical protein